MGDGVWHGGGPFQGLGSVDADANYEVDHGEEDADGCEVGHSWHGGSLGSCA
jgi:hypothetical protein